ncbi:ABC transporter permease [Anopheles sinensis]|uniref:ABC transporter permease n=1 Tax=Anopheles sinensis TaxID=74873 RepID=A0A084VBJ2_ANOSI|nr:ABC transporter permease [Anopheles sinensis]
MKIETYSHPEAPSTRATTQPRERLCVRYYSFHPPFLRSLNVMLQGKTILQRIWKLSVHPSKKHKKRMTEPTPNGKKTLPCKAAALRNSAAKKCEEGRANECK